MFAVEIEGRDRPQADELPGHCLLYSLGPHSYRELPLRIAEPATCTATSSPACCTGPAGAPLRPGRRAHLLHDRADPGRAARVPRLRVLPLRPLRPRHARGALAATRRQAGPTRSGISPKRSCARRWPSRASTTSRARAKARSTGRRSTCTCPTRSGAAGSSARCARPPDAEAVRAHLPGRRQRRAHAGDDPPRASARSSGSSASTRAPAATCRSSSRPSRCGSCRSQPRISPTPSRSPTGPLGGLQGLRGRAGGDARAADPRRRAREGALRRRLGRPRVARLRRGPATGW